MKFQIAETIKRLRVERGLTQSDLAALLSVSPQAVSRWENDLSYPDIESLPLLAKYLEVSLDELRGVEELKSRQLSKELRMLLRESSSEGTMDVARELRILDLYERLSSSDVVYLMGYFQRLMSMRDALELSSSRIDSARTMLRDRMHEGSLELREKLLFCVAMWEEEEKLSLWESEFMLARWRVADSWRMHLLSRYERRNDLAKWKAQNQELLFESVLKSLFHLTNFASGEGRGDENTIVMQFRTAFEMLELYSAHVEDLFLMKRIELEVRFALALSAVGRREEALSLTEQATAHLKLLHGLPEGTVLRGSVPMLAQVSVVLREEEKLTCVMSIPNCHTDHAYDHLRGDGRFEAFSNALGAFFPQDPCRSWVTKGLECEMDDAWMRLLEYGRQEVGALSDGNVVVVLTAKRKTYALRFPNTVSATEAEGVTALLADMKRNADVRIERLVCLWHDGVVDMPAMAFREALLGICPENRNARILLRGTHTLVEKTLGSTMPKKA